MIPLQFNLECLQESFINFHQPLLIGAIPGATALNRYIASCHRTNEITGLHRDGKNIFPIFVEGIDRTAVLKSLIGDYAKKIAINPAEKCITHKEFTIRNYWQADDFKTLVALHDISNPLEIIAEARRVAFNVLERSPENLGIVCGPISSGEHSIETNLAIFHKTVVLVAQDMPIFNQLPFEPVLEKAHFMLIKDYSHLLRGLSTSEFFIDRFYKPIFETKKQWQPHFIHGSEKSIGATGERVYFESKSIKVKDLSRDYHIN